MIASSAPAHRPTEASRCWRAHFVLAPRPDYVTPIARRGQAEDDRQRGEACNEKQRRCVAFCRPAEDEAPTSRASVRGSSHCANESTEDHSGSASAAQMLRVEEGHHAAGMAELTALRRPRAPVLNAIDRMSSAEPRAVAFTLFEIALRASRGLVRAWAKQITGHCRAVARRRAQRFPSRPPAALRLALRDHPFSLAVRGIGGQAATCTLTGTVAAASRASAISSRSALA